MRRLTFFSIIFALIFSETNLFADEIFGEKLDKHATVQVINNLSAPPSSWSGEYVTVFGVQDNINFIWNAYLDKNKTVQVTSGYSRLFCFNKTVFFVLQLEAGHEYIVKLEGNTPNTYVASVLDTTTMTTQNISGRRY